MNDVDFNIKQYDLILDLVNRLEDEQDIIIKSDLNEQIAEQLDLLYDKNNLSSTYIEKHIKAILQSNFTLCERVSDSEKYPNLLYNDIIFQSKLCSSIYIHFRFIANRVELTFMRLHSYDLYELDKKLLDGFKHISVDANITSIIVQTVSL